MEGRSQTVGTVLVLAGLGFFAASIYFMHLYNVLASLMSAVLGFTAISIGVDLLKR